MTQRITHDEPVNPSREDQVIMAVNDYETRIAAVEVPLAEFEVVPVINTIYARTTGDDDTGAGTLLSPYKTLQRAVRDVPLNIPRGVRYVVDVTGITETTPIDYVLPQWKAPWVAYDPVVAGDVFAVVAAVTIQAEPQLVAALSEEDATIAAADIIAQTAQTGSALRLIEISRNGTGDSFSVAAGVVTLTDSAAQFTATMVGMPITIAGSTTPENDGTFTVASFTSSSIITFANASGVTEAFPGTWVIGDTRASWATNAIKGKFIIGATAPDNNVIIESSSSSILTTSTLSLSGELLIKEPSAIISCTRTLSATVTGGFCARNIDSLALYGLKITTPLASCFALEASGCGQLVTGLCELESPLILSWAIQHTRAPDRCWIYGDQVRFSGDYQVIRCLIDAPTALQHSAMGPQVINYRNTAIIGGAVPRFCQSNFSGQSAVSSLAPVSLIMENILISGISGASGDGIRWHGGKAVIRNADIRSCGRDGIRCELGSGFMELINVHSTAANTGTGVRVSDGMIVKVDSATSAAGTPISGASDMIVGSGSSRTWADFLSGASGRPVNNEYDLTAIAGTSGTFDDASDAAAYITGTGSRLFQ